MPKLATVIMTTLLLSIGSHGAIARPLNDGLPWRQTHNAPVMLAQRGQFSKFTKGELLSKLNLSADQKRELLAIRNRYQAQMDSLSLSLRSAYNTMRTLMVGGTATRTQLEAQHQEISSLRQEMTELKFSQMMDIREVLTPAQRQEMQAYLWQKHGGNARFNGNKRNDGLNF